MTEHPAKISGKPSKTRRVLYALVKVVLLAAVLYFVGRMFVRQWHEVKWDETHFAVGPLCLAVLSIVCGRISVGFAYWFLLGHFGSRLSLRAAMTCVWLPQMGKYIPGKVASLLGAVWVMGRHGVPPARATRTAIVIVVLSILLGMMMAVPLTLWKPVYKELPLGRLWCVLFVSAGLVALHPRVLNVVLHLPMKKMGLATDDAPVRISDYGLPAVFLVLNWCFMGLALWFASRSVATVSATWIPLMISTAALAITIGFVAFFAPSGVGVREGILLSVLRIPVGEVGLVVTVAMRLLHALVDLLLAGVSLLILRYTASRDAAEVPTESAPSPLSSDQDA